MPHRNELMKGEISGVSDGHNADVQTRPCSLSVGKTNSPCRFEPILDFFLKYMIPFLLLHPPPSSRTSFIMLSLDLVLWALDLEGVGYTFIIHVSAMVCVWEERKTTCLLKYLCAKYFLYII